MPRKLVVRGSARGGVGYLEGIEASDGIRPWFTWKFCLDVVK